MVQIAVMAEKSVHGRGMITGQDEMGAVDLPIGSGIQVGLGVADGLFRGSLVPGILDLVSIRPASHRPKTDPQEKKQFSRGCVGMNGGFFDRLSGKFIRVYLCTSVANNGFSFLHAVMPATS